MPREHGLTRKSHANISNKPQNRKALEVLTPLSAQCIHSPTTPGVGTVPFIHRREENNSTEKSSDCS